VHFFLVLQKKCVAGYVDGFSHVIKRFNIGHDAI